MAFFYELLQIIVLLLSIINSNWSNLLKIEVIYYNNGLHWAFFPKSLVVDELENMQTKMQYAFPARLIDNDRNQLQFDDQHEHFRNTSTPPFDGEM